MQISSSSAATSSMALSALRDLFQTKTTDATGQKTPTEGAKGPPQGPPPGPPPAGMNGGGVSPDTMSSLLGTQEDGAAKAASDAIDEADTNGDGTVSLAELAASLGTDEASVTSAFAKVDTDQDGQINADELESGLKSVHGRHGPPPPPSASDVALDVLASADADKSGALSLGEVSSSLGEKDGASLTDAFAALDKNGDGSLASDELTSAVEAMFARQMAAYAANGTTQASSSVSRAA